MCALRLSKRPAHSRPTIQLFKGPFVALHMRIIQVKPSQHRYLLSCPTGLTCAKQPIQPRARGGAEGVGGHRPQR
jgi:hypothetical protein